MRRVGSKPAPGLIDGDRPRGGKILAEFAMAFQGRGDRRVVGGTQDDRDLSRREPPRGGQVSRAQRGSESGALLPENGGGAADATACGAGLPRRRLHV